MAYLAFGPAARPRRWVAGVPALRVAALGAVAWGLVVLLMIDAAVWDPGNKAGDGNQPAHHMVIALDVSPSMELKDAGPAEDQTRAERARDVLRSILDRVDLHRTRISIVAFYTEARPVVVDTFDREVVANIVNDLPLEHAFTPGKTDMYQSVESAAEIGRTWPPKSASLVFVSDGDTLPAADVPLMPPAFGGKLILGVGHPHRGLYIDGHSSRQDTGSLERLALRLGGHYYNANTRHVPSADLKRLVASLPLADRGVLELRDVAIWAVAAGAALLALLAPLLAAAGNAWNPQRPRPVESGLRRLQPQS
jgi:Ca-activated chloride channel family protein